jgi:hypothetical protein
MVSGHTAVLQEIVCRIDVAVGLDLLGWLAGNEVAI